jgi:hypothetical protein
MLVRHGRVVAGHAIEHVIKGEFRILRTAGLTVQDEFLGLAKGTGIHEDHVLLWCGVEGVRHGFASGEKFVGFSAEESTV